MQLIRSAATLAAFAFALSSTLAVAHGPAEHATQTVAEPARRNCRGADGHRARRDRRRHDPWNVATVCRARARRRIARCPARRSSAGARARRHGRSARTPERQDAVRRRLACARCRRCADTKALTEIDGTLAILHADDFANGQSSFVYEVHHASGSVHQLRLAATLSALEPGMKVRVHGRISADSATMTPDRITILSRQAAAAEDVATKAATANGVLVIMANFNNTISARIQHGAGAAGDDDQQRQRRQLLSRNVVRPAGDECHRDAGVGHDEPGPADDVRIGGLERHRHDRRRRSQGASSALYDPASYNFVVYVFPPLPACGWSGLAYIGYPHQVLDQWHGRLQDHDHHARDGP